MVLAHLDQLPAIRWKLHNLGQQELKNPKKFAEQVEALARRLGESRYKFFTVMRQNGSTVAIIIL